MKSSAGLGSRVKPRELIQYLAIALVLAGNKQGLGADAVLGPEQDWERTVKAAEEEGQVVVYKIAHDAEWHAFQKRFPKIKVVLIPGNAAQIQQRLLAERRAGKLLADVVRLGGGTSTSLYKAKALDPIASALILPEVNDRSKWFDGRHSYNDGENQYSFIYAAFPLSQSTARARLYKKAPHGWRAHPGARPTRTTANRLASVRQVSHQHYFQGRWCR